MDFAFHLFWFNFKRKNLAFQVLNMGCTVSGVNRNNFERALVRGVANNKRGQLLVCGREKKTKLQTEKRKYSGKIELFRTTDLPKTLTTKKIIESPQMTALSDSISNERNTRVYLSTGLNKEAFHRLDGKWEGTKTEQIIQGTHIMFPSRI